MQTLSLLSCEIELDRGLVRPKTGEPRELTTREADLLRYLAGRPSVAVSRDELLAQVWGYADAVVTRVCDNTVRRLREKIEADPSRPDHLITVHGTGYRFEPRSAPLPPPAPADAPAPAPLPGQAPLLEALFLGERQVDLGRARVTGPGFEAELSGTEVALLRRLLKAGGAVVERQALLREIWGSQRSPGRAVDHAVRRLRGKIEPDPREPAFLLTASGGYRLEVPTGTRISQEEVLGRAALLAELSDALARSGWVLLVGPPGVGKTTLARAAAARFSSVIRVDAGHCRTSDELVASVGRALAVPLGDDAPSPSPTLPKGADRIGRALAARCAGGRALLLLDNLEPVPGLGELIAHWRATAPELRALGTSRTRLGAPGEQVIEVGPLEPDAAVELFVRRARSASRSLSFEEAAMRDIRALVDRLGRLPLAIELAAARMPLISPAGLLARLGSRLLDVLSALRVTMESAVSALAPENREALLALSLFVSSFTLDDAEERLGPSALDRVAALRDHSMLQGLPSGEGHVRLAVFPVLREYAAELRRALPDRGRRMVLAHVQRLAHLGTPGYLARLSHQDTGPERLRQRALVDELAAAAHLAVEIGEPELACQCAIGAGWTHRIDGAISVGLALGETVLAACPTRDLPWAQLVMRVGQLYYLDGRYSEARSYYEVAEQLLIARGEHLELATLHGWWASLCLVSGDPAGRRLHMQRAHEYAAKTPYRAYAGHFAGKQLMRSDPAAAERAMVEALADCGPDLGQRARLLDDLGWLAMRQGQLAEAWARHLEVLEAWKVLGIRVHIPGAYASLVHLAVGRGDLASAGALAREGLTLAREMAMPVEEAMLLGYWGLAELLQGELDRAWETLSSARTLLERWGSPRTLGYVEIRLAEVSLARGDAATALALAARSEERNADISEPWNQAVAESIRALALSVLGRLDEARALAERALAGLEEHGDPHDQMVGLCRLGQVAASQGDAARWAACLQRAEELARAHALDRPMTEAAQALAALRSAWPGASTGSGAGG